MTFVYKCKDLVLVLKHIEMNYLVYSRIQLRTEFVGRLTRQHVLTSTLCQARVSPNCFVDAYASLKQFCLTIYSKPTYASLQKLKPTWAQQGHLETRAGAHWRAALPTNLLRN